MEEKQITMDDERNQEFQNFTFDMEGLKLAFWGLLFTIINIRIQGFDIVPDFIGYIMVAIGLSRIEKYEDKFSSAKTMSYILLVLAIINIYQAPVQNTVNQGGMMTTSGVSFSAGVLGSNPLLAFIVMVAGFTVNIYFVYFMCMGMKSLLLQTGDTTLAGICEERWKLILGAQMGLLISILLAMLMIPFATVMTLLFAALALIALVLFLLLVNHAYQSIHGKGRMI